MTVVQNKNKNDYVQFQQRDRELKGERQRKNGKDRKRKINRDSQRERKLEKNKICGRYFACHISVKMKLV